MPGYVKMLKIMLHATSGKEAASLVVIFLGIGKHRSSWVTALVEYPPPLNNAAT